MTDRSNQWIVQQIQECKTGNNLWCCDENILHEVTDAHDWPAKPLLISNRWDLAEKATQIGFNSQFNDFDLGGIADNSVDNFFYRISKEKAVVHHLINQVLRVLKPLGTLYLCGQKSEGIKTYIEKACTLLACEKKIQKDGASYSSYLCKNTLSSGHPTAKVEDSNYTELREIARFNNQLIFSKPGQFGWNKIDEGSAFLIDEISSLLAEQVTSYESCLDLGCGYGFLSIASQYLPIKHRTLTDNNAAALISAHRNSVHFQLPAEIVASDAGASIDRRFDLILCNPPFHQGFSIDGDLTDKFLLNTKRLLAFDGVAYFVVNQFIPLEKKARSHFKTVNCLAQNKSFKVLELRIF